ncbi:MAG: hypothetical protein ACRDJ5_08755 [Actinomycetota bacterium]
MRADTQRAPEVSDSRVTFFCDEPGDSFDRVELVQELRRPRVGPAFERRDGSGGWELSFERPDVARMEYQLQVTNGDGSTQRLCDPGNELRASGPFGERSSCGSGGSPASPARY